MLTLTRTESCVTVREDARVRVVTWFTGSRNGQYWALDKETGVDAYGETVFSALLSLNLKLRGFGVVENRKKSKRLQPLAATAAKHTGE